MNKIIKKNSVARCNASSLSGEEISTRLLMLRNQPVLLDRDVADLYQVGTKRIIG